MTSGFLLDDLEVAATFIVVLSLLERVAFERYVFDIKMHYAKSWKLLSCGEIEIMKIRSYEN